MSAILKVLAHLTKHSLSRLSVGSRTLGKGRDSKLATLHDELKITYGHVLSLVQLDTAHKVDDLHAARRRTAFDILHEADMPWDPFTYIKGVRVPDTGEWLIREHDFQRWTQRLIPHLWLSGGPGVGKTYVASTAISHLLSRPQSVNAGMKVSTAYTFFSKTSGKSPPDMVRDGLYALAHQICQSDRTYEWHVRGLPPHAISGSFAQTWRELFVQFYSNSGRALYLVMDGLDEIGVDEEGSRDELLSIILDMDRKSFDLDVEQ